MDPLTDELSDEAKAELAAVFADLRRRLEPPPRAPRRGMRPWWER